VSLLAERLLEIHRALSRAGLPYAFGGAIALAYCSREPRGTRDLDVNVFVAPDRAAEVFDALPPQVTAKASDLSKATEEGQVRLWWEETPVDIFLDVHEFHRDVQQRVVEVSFEGSTIPVLDCTALTVFKALFNRTRDWADIEEMISSGSLDADCACGWLRRIQGDDSPGARRVARLADAATAMP